MANLFSYRAFQHKDNTRNKANRAMEAPYLLSSISKAVHPRNKVDTAVDSKAAMEADLHHLGLRLLEMSEPIRS
jgi:hypothetical protein